MKSLQSFVNDCSTVTSSATPETSSFFHFGCLENLINLIVKESLKELCDLVEKLCNTFLWIHGSSPRLVAFDKALVDFHIDFNKKHPTKDVPTRWNSTFPMIESSPPCKLAFQDLKIKDNGFKCCPNKFECRELTVVKYLFNCFTKASFLFCHTHTPIFES